MASFLGEIIRNTRSSVKGWHFPALSAMMGHPEGETAMAYELQAEIRKEKNPRALRRQGKIPGVVYGPNIHQLVTFNRKDLERLLSKITRSSRIKLKLDDKEIDTFLKEIQHDPLTDQVIHVDLYHPPADRPITMEVPIKLYGEAKGRKSGGIVDQLREVVVVRGPAEKIPELIELDISGLDIHESIKAGEIPLPEGVQLITPPEALLVTVLAPRKVEEVLAEEAVAAEAEAPEEGEEAAPAEEAEEKESE